MNRTAIYRMAIMILVIALNVGCDQVAKTVVRHHLVEEQQIGLLKEHLIITRVENTGAFLSLGNALSGPARLIALLVLPIAAIGAALYYLFRKSNLSPGMLVALCFVIGGGLGNLYDRAMHGSVTDFLYMNFVIFHTGIFNLADVSITTGVIIILYNIYFGKRKLTTTATQ